MTTYVIDASVAIKWAFEEKYCSEALQFMDDRIRRIAPDFILLECSSAIQKKVWRHEIQDAIGWQGYEYIFLNDPILLYNSKPLIQSAYNIANQLCHSIYDCIYLTMAINEHAIVVTADLKFYERVKNSSYSKHLTWVENAPEITE